MGYNLSSVRMGFKALLEKKFFRNVFVIFSGTAIAQGIVFLASLFLARLYSVDDFGYFQYYQSFLGFIIVMGCFRYDFAILVADTEEEVLNLGALAAIIISLFTLLLCVIISIILIFDIQIEWIPKKILHYLWFIPISFFAASIYQVLSQMLIRFSNFKLVSKTKIAQSIGLSSAQLAGAFISKGPFGLFLGDVIGKAFGITSILRWLKNKFSNTQRKINKNDLRSVAAKYKNYAIYSTPGTLLNSAGIYLPSFFWGGFFGYNVLGYFSLADKIFLIPFLLIGQSIAQVYAAKMRELITEKSTAILSFFKKIVFRTAIFLIIPMIVFSIFAPSIFSFVFGAKWRIAGEFTSILTIMQFFGFISGITTFTLVVLQKQKIQLIWEALRIICVLIMFFLIKTCSIPLERAILFYSILMALFYLLHLYLSYRFVNAACRQWK